MKFNDFEQMKQDAALNDNIAHRAKIDFDMIDLMAKMSAFRTESAKMAELIRTIDKYFDTIYDGSIKSEEYAKFKEAILDIEVLIESAEIQQREHFREQYNSIM